MKDPSFCSAPVPSSPSPKSPSPLPHKRSSRPYLLTQLGKQVLLQNPNVSPAKMQPADHMSMDVEYSLAPKRTSGGRYHSVTTWRRPHPQGAPSHLECWREVQEGLREQRKQRGIEKPLGDSFPSTSQTTSQAHLSRVAADWDTKGSSQAKISQFQLPILRGDNTRGTWRRLLNGLGQAPASFSPSLAPVCVNSLPVPRAIPCL